MAEMPGPLPIADTQTTSADHDEWQTPWVYELAPLRQVPAVAWQSKQQSAWLWAVISAMVVAVIVPTVVLPGMNRTSRTAPGSLAYLLPPTVRHAGKIIVGTTAADQAPVAIAAGGTMRGLDPDLLRAMGRTLGIQVVFVRASRAALIQGVESGRYGVAASGLSDTSARRGRVDFVDYFVAGSAIAVRAGNPGHVRSPADLCNKRVAIVPGSSGDAMITAQKCIEVLALPTVADALAKVRAGMVDACVTDFPSAEYAARAQDSGITVVSSQIDPGPYGFAVAKGDPKLRQALKAALDAIIDDGTYGLILARYHLAGGAVTAARVNGGS